MGGLHAAFTDLNATKEQMVDAISNATPAGLAQVLDMPGIKKSKVLEAVEELQDAAADDPAKFEMLEEMHKISNQMDPSYVSQRDFDLGMDLIGTAAKASVAATAIAPTVGIMREVTDQVLSNKGNVDTSVWTQWLGEAQKAAVALTGSSDLDVALSRMTGAKSEQLIKMSRAEKILLFELGRQKVENQGTVSDAERMMLMETMISGSTSTETRLQAISHMDAMNELDILIYPELVRHAGPNLEHSRSAQFHKVTVLTPMLDPLTTAFTNSDLLNRAEALYNEGTDERYAHHKEYADISKAYNTAPHASQEWSDARDKYTRLRAPTLTAEQAQAAALLMKKKKITHYWSDAIQDLVPRPSP